MTAFLAPADPDNAKRSLLNAVDRRAVKTALGNERQYEALEREIGTQGKLYCWAVRESKQGTFRNMKKGDEVFFSLRGSGSFGLRGIIIATVESSLFARRFWDDERLTDWRYVYFLRDVVEDPISKAKLRALLGYDKNDRFQGLRRLPPERLRGFALLKDLIDAGEVPERKQSAKA